MILEWKITFFVFYLDMRNIQDQVKFIMDTIVTLLDHSQLAITLASLFTIYVFARMKYAHE